MRITRPAVRQPQHPDVGAGVPARRQPLVHLLHGLRRSGRDRRRTDHAQRPAVLRLDRPRPWPGWTGTALHRPDERPLDGDRRSRRDPGRRWLQRSTGRVWGPGHHSFFQSPDGTEDWIAYHGKNTSTYTYAFRTARVQKISWNADGTPNLGSPLAAGATQNLPSSNTVISLDRIEIYS
ncbi:family 43 glycosylhydrolase [Streptomyces sp. SID13031]|uniref:family 43 glycosylhydrolase n=1 Tax=Streptomyces sp. SID13031 TaxID=2706046 RepID=UPI0031BB877E